MGNLEDRNKMETSPGLPPFVRRWAAQVNAAIADGPGWVTTTTTAAPTTTTTTA